jgi:hypothetical protein
VRHVRNQAGFPGAHVRHEEHEELTRTISFLFVIFVALRGEFLFSSKEIGGPYHWLFPD